MKGGLRGNIFRFAVSFAALGLVVFFMRGKLDEACHVLRAEAQWNWILFSIFLYFLAICLLAVRLLFVFTVQKIRLNFGEALYLNLIGLFFNLFLPSAVGGDIAKAYYAYKHSGKKLESVTSVLLDRLMGFSALMVMAPAAVLVYSKQLGDPRLAWAVYGFVFAMFSLTAFLASKRFARLFSFLLDKIPQGKFRQRLSDVYHAIYYYKKHLKVLFLTWGISLISQSFFILIYYTLARSLGLDLNPWLFFVIVPLIAVFSMIPSIGGLGVREAGSVILFSRFMAQERALALSLLLDMLIYGYSFASGIVFMLRGGLKSKVIHEMEALQ